MMKKIFLIIVLLVLGVGCALPIPHKRLHIYGVKSRVVDNETNKPIPDATICSFTEERNCAKSDKTGAFELPPIYGWHGGYFIGPISTSFWPGFDIPQFDPEIVIQVQGYKDTRLSVVSESAPENDFMLLDEIRINK
jgi:hypothetical protein